MSKLEFVKQDNYTRCMNSAVYSLAMREHSRLEIHNKLKKKDYVEGVDIEALLDELEENNYLNEERFVESFIRGRASRGQGTLKIINDLKMRGISSFLINQGLEESEVNWFDLATAQLEKKFGLNKSIDFREKAKRMRFLTGRGFSSDIVRNVVE